VSWFVCEFAGFNCF